MQENRLVHLCCIFDLSSLLRPGWNPSWSRNTLSHNSIFIIVTAMYKPPS
jgi:hypothetical protein